jgi:hypothetical protein
MLGLIQRHLPSPHPELAIACDVKNSVAVKICVCTCRLELIYLNGFVSPLMKYRIFNDVCEK